MRTLLALIFGLVFSASVMSQTDLEKEMNESYSADEIVTLSEKLPFDNAVEILSKISMKMTGRKIVSQVALTGPIGVGIVKLPYKKALTIVVQYNNLMFEETPDVIVIKARKEQGAASSSEGVKSGDTYAPVSSREVKISAVIFEADNSAMRSRGVNWKFLLSNNSGFSSGVNLTTFAEATSSSTTTTTTDFKANAGSTFTSGKFSGSVSDVFRMFEEESLGEVIASPNITVRNMQKGRIQIGSDYSIKQKDFAGNVTDKFFSTGSIVEVTPYIYREDSTDYILLQLSVERSSATPSEISTEIKKTSANTQVLMLNGEETVIGGLFVNDETIDRTGIPFLKDLPWWVFGIRYLTGSDSKVLKKKEVVILIKTELLPTLKERRLANDKFNKLERSLKDNREVIQKYKPLHSSESK